MAAQHRITAWLTAPNPTAMAATVNAKLAERPRVRQRVVVNVEEGTLKLDVQVPSTVDRDELRNWIEARMTGSIRGRLIYHLCPHGDGGGASVGCTTLPSYREFRR